MLFAIGPKCARHAPSRQVAAAQVSAAAWRWHTRHGVNRASGPVPVRHLDFGPDDLPLVRATERDTVADFAPSRATDIVLAVHEVAINAIVHGRGRGHLRVERADDELVFHVKDGNDTLTRPEVRAADPEAPRGRGLWLAERLADLLHIDTTPGATSVHLHVRADPATRVKLATPSV